MEIGFYRGNLGEIKYISGLQCYLTDALIKKRRLGHMERHQGWVCTEERPCEDTERRGLYASQGERPQKKPNPAAP